MYIKVQPCWMQYLYSTSKLAQAHTIIQMVSLSLCLGVCVQSLFRYDVFLFAQHKKITAAEMRDEKWEEKYSLKLNQSTICFTTVFCVCTVQIYTININIFVHSIIFTFYYCKNGMETATVNLLIRLFCLGKTYNTFQLYYNTLHVSFFAVALFCIVFFFFFFKIWNIRLNFMI